MDKFLSIFAFSAGLIVAIPVSAKVAGVTADGTWDCIDGANANAGAIVIVDTNYAFIKPDGLVGPYGHLFRTGQEQFDLPNFVIVDGYLKEAMTAIGLTMSGPRDHPHDLSGEHFLNVILTETTVLYCTRRKAPTY